MRAAVLVGCVAGACAYEASPVVRDDAEWNAFKTVHNRQYSSPEHEEARYWIFKSNADVIRAHNAKQSSFQMGMNDFSDLTLDEFSESHFGVKMPTEMWQGAKKLGTHSVRAGEELPSSVDWTSKGAVTPIKNQGSCGSCWSFSSTGALEGAWEIATGQLVSMSEQQFVDCNKQNSGCSGGWMDYAFKYAEGVGLCTEDSYPYTKKDGTCNLDGCSVAIPKGGVTGFVDVDHTEEAMMSAVAQQPVAIAIEADKLIFQFYMFGVVHGNCGTNLDHGVLNVGYGTSSGTKYWKVKNSWGSWWGEGGYVKVLRGKGGDGECGILLKGSYPRVTTTTAQSLVV